MAQGKHKTGARYKHAQTSEHTGLPRCAKSLQHAATVDHGDDGKQHYALADTAPENDLLGGRLLNHANRQPLETPKNTREEHHD